MISDQGSMIAVARSSSTTRTTRDASSPNELPVRQKQDL